MTTNEPSRLDRLEALAESTLLSIAELRQAQDRTQQQIDSNARAIEANSAAIAQGRQETNAVREDLSSATQMILDLGEFLGNQFDRLERQFEQDRAERLALSADVRSLVEALRERFRSNGHS